MIYLFSIIKIILLIIPLTLISLYFFQRKFIYHPTTSKPNLNSNLSKYYKAIQTKTNEGFSLTHWIFRSSKKPTPWIVIFHGNAGNIESRGYKYQFLTEAGYSVLLSSYRGYGGNPGSPKESHIIQDSSLILKWLMEKETLSPSNIILYGESLGSCVSIAIARKYSVQKMILEGAPSSILEVGQKHAFPFLPIRWLLKDTWNSKLRIQSIKTPLLFIHGKQDRVVPFRFGFDLYQSAQQPKTGIWLENRGHNDLLDDPFTKQAILQFISNPSRLPQ